MSDDKRWYRAPDGNASTFGPADEIPAGWLPFDLAPGADGLVAPVSRVEQLEKQLAAANAEILRLTDGLAEIAPQATAEVDRLNAALDARDAEITELRALLAKFDGDGKPGGRRGRSPQSAE